jgi:hypothetical protein
MRFPSYSARAALVVAHPSHELRLHGWLEQAKPCVSVLTDGGGRSGEPRLDRTTEVLSRAGATQGAIYGRLSDLDVYAAILDGDADLFSAIVEELAQEFATNRIEYVVGDAAEGYSVTHDICRVMIGAAANMAERRYGHRVENFDFMVVGPPDECPNDLRDDAIWLQLDDEAFGRKVKAALGYTPKLAKDIEAALAGAPFRGVLRFSQPQLAGEIDVEVSTSVGAEMASHPALKKQHQQLVDGQPLDSYRVECLRPVDNQAGTHWTTEQRPFYELYGEKLVAAGRYERVIRYEEHMLPLAQAIRAKVEREERCVRSAS